MGIWSRISTLFKSNVNSAISKSENPEKILEQLVRDMREQLMTAKKQVAVALADEKKLKKKFEEKAAEANDWEQKARTAVNANRDDLAMEALSRQKEATQLAQEYKKQYEAQKQATEKLRSSLHELNDKIEEARRKKDLLIARQRRAKAQSEIHQTLSGMGDNTAFDTFDRMADKVDQMEAQADAEAELSDDMSGNDLEDQFRELEQSQGGNDALASLKSRMGKSDAGEQHNAPKQQTVESSEMSVDDLEKEFDSLQAKK